MANNPLLAYVRGRPDQPSITEVNVRADASGQAPVLFRVTVGTSLLPVLDAQPDPQGLNQDGKIFQWLRLSFPNGQSGWVRDDLLEISGDGTKLGYGVLPARTHAFSLTRRPLAPATPGSAPAPVVPAAAVPAPASPAAPAAPGTPPSAGPAPIPTPPVVPTPAPSGAAMAIPITQSQAPTRSGPAITFPRTGIFLARGVAVPLLDVQRESGGQNYRWFKVAAQGQQVWVREDLVTYTGNTQLIGLPTDLYPSPMKSGSYWWVRGFNMPPNMDANLPQHDGWDLGAATGEPILCGPNGGTVVRVVRCTKCTPDRPSTLMHGFSLGDSAVFQGPAWGFGYGHFVIVRYTFEQLPQSTRGLLAARGMPGGAIFVNYAHLNDFFVSEGQTLTGGQQIGTCGNTGNSEAPHLHLEIRAAASPIFTSWANIRSGVMDAVALFNR